MYVGWSHFPRNHRFCLEHVSLRIIEGLKIYTFLGCDDRRPILYNICVGEAVYNLLNSYMFFVFFFR